MKLVGVTGGVGTGKSTVCKIFALYGVPILYADDLAKHLMTHDPTLREQISQLLGSEAYKGEQLNSTYISNKIYAHAPLKGQLEALVHPVVKETTEDWVEQKKSQGYSYVIKEAAIMVESGTHLMLDSLIVVTSPKELRIKRLADNRAYTRERSQDIMNAQMPDNELKKYADFEILNNQNQSLILQVADIHQKLLQ